MCSDLICICFFVFWFGVFSLGGGCLFQRSHVRGALRRHRLPDRRSRLQVLLSGRIRRAQLFAAEGLHTGAQSEAGGHHCAHRGGHDAHRPHRQRRLRHDGAQQAGHARHLQPQSSGDVQPASGNGPGDEAAARRAPHLKQENEIIQTLSTYSTPYQLGQFLCTDGQLKISNET